MNPLSRRDLLTRTAPAIAAGVALTQLPSVALTQEVDAERAGSVVARLIRDSFADGQYKLPALPYAYDALEPHIDAQTMELHHSRHHNAYVNNLNRTLESLAALRDGEIDPARLSALQRDISFNAGGHILHSVFFATMAPNAGGDPDGEIARGINRAFGSIEGFKKHFTAVAAGVKGSGWALLVYEPVGDQLLITESGDQDLRMIPGGAPLLGVDVWEHAYYLRYQNRRGEYINAWWNTVNWSAVNDAYVATRRMYGFGE